MRFIGIILSILFAKAFGQTRYPCRQDSLVPSIHNHASSCSKYVLCIAGETVVRDCAPGLKFDLQSQSCLPENVANCDIENRECPPYDDPNNLIFIPGYECEQYFICNQGVKLEQRCSIAFHWDLENSWCDFPDNVNCPNRVECPEEGIAYVPHPTICEMFFFCVQGNAHLLSCPSDLIFDIVIERCNVPDQATCIIDQK